MPVSAPRDADSCHQIQSLALLLVFFEGIFYGLLQLPS